MNKQEYMENVLKTESGHNVSLDLPTSRLLHAAMGMVTESAEMLDQLKKHIFYGKNLDIDNLKEELGDEFWYAFVAMNVLKTDIETIFDLNIEKLKKRYPAQTFEKEKAIERDTKNEMSHFDGSSGKPLPCGSCGSSVILVGKTEGAPTQYWVYCSSCGQSSPNYGDKGTAVESWNHGFSRKE